MTDQPPPPILTGSASLPPSGDERNMAMLCHLLGIIASYTIGLGFVGPLIIWLLKKDSSAFIDYHGKEALNFQLSMMLYLVLLGAFTFVLMFVVVGLLLIPVIVAVAIAGLVLEILACVAASRGEWHRYPLCIRFIQ